MAGRRGVTGRGEGGWVRFCSAVLPLVTLGVLAARRSIYERGFFPLSSSKSKKSSLMWLWRDGSPACGVAGAVHEESLAVSIRN